MELINTHCHSVYSGHGDGEIADYVAVAREKGLSTLAFTEHYPLSDAFDPTHHVSIAPQRLQNYLDDIADAKAANPGLEILYGCELDYLGDDEDRDLKLEDFEVFDIVLGSVHIIDRWAFDNPHNRDRWDIAEEPDRIWRRYFDLWCQAVADTTKPYTVMAHPDLPKKFGVYPNADLQQFYNQATEAIVGTDRMVEVNTSGGYYACHEMFPAPAFLQSLCKAGIPCTVGADSHTPANVARDIEAAYKYMYDAGYRQVTVPTAHGDRRTIDL